MISVVLLLIAFSIDWAKKCKAVNYKYTAYKNKQLHGGGCPKGCFGYYNDTDYTDNFRENGDEWKTDHWEKSKCVECSTMKDLIIAKFNDYVFAGTGGTLAGTVNETELADACEGRGTTVSVDYEYLSNPAVFPGSLSETVNGCQWDSKKKKCVETSCPYKAEREKCNGNWTKGKCAKRKGDTCLAYDYVRELPNTEYYYVGYPYYQDFYIFEKLPTGTSCLPTITDGADLYALIPRTGPQLVASCGDVHGGWVSCNDLDKYYKYTRVNGSNNNFRKPIKFTADDVKHCNYLCENPQRGFSYPTYDYSIETRKECNKVYGCLYSDYKAGQGGQTCSYWAIWAFILFLVLVILFFIAIIVVIVIIVIKLRGKKTTKVEDGAAQSKAADSAAPVDSEPPPPSGPYVVIKLGKQEKLTKKDQSSVWGESVIFTGLGAEDDDVEFELHDDSGALLGNVNVRIPEYVNTKKRATLSLKSGEAAIGTLETDIEIQVQEEPEVKITGVFYVDKFIAV